jgi:hypothetical protein
MTDEHENVIILCDLFFGTQKYVLLTEILIFFRKIVPKKLDFELSIWTYIGLSINRGFIFYGTFGSRYVSLISINLEDETYELIGIPYELPSVYLVLFYWINYIPNYGVLLKCNYYNEETREWPPEVKLHIFKFDSSLSTIEFHRSLSIPFTGNYFHVIDGKIVFSNTNRACFNEKAIFENFMQVNDDYSLTEFENTHACLKTNFLFDNENNRTKVVILEKYQSAAKLAK